MTILAILLVGLLTGARTFAPVALVAWASAFGWLDSAGTWVGWLGTPAAAAVLTLLALGELYGDKQPEAGNRTVWLALVGRMVVGALAGAAVALGADAALSGAMGAGLGAAAAAVGTFITFHFRAFCADRMGKDLPAALLEDALVIGGTVLAIVLTS